MSEYNITSRAKKTLATGLFLSTLLAGCESGKRDTPPTPSYDIPSAAFSAESRVRPIDATLAQTMQGATLRDFPGCATAETLRIVDVPYHSFDGASKMGALVIRDTLADEVGDMFEEIYETGFQIEHIALPEDITKTRSNDPEVGVAIDDELMAKNITSAFNCRTLNGKPDKHGQGRAIDINPLQNPMITPNPFVTKNAPSYNYSPPAAQGTWETTAPERLLSSKSKVGSKVIAIFKKYGWRWGGDFKTLYDGQHFDKP